MGQKQGSSTSLQHRDERPKTNQSSKRPFIHSQPSFDQNTVQHKPVEHKSYSLTMQNNKNGLRPSPIKA